MSSEEHKSGQRKIRLNYILELQKVYIEESKHILSCPECQQRLVAIEECMDSITEEGK